MKTLLKSTISILCLGGFLLLNGCKDNNVVESADMNATAMQIQKAQIESEIEKAKDFKEQAKKHEIPNDADDGRMGAVKTACDKSDAKAFIENLAYSRNIASKFIAANISIETWQAAKNDGENFKHAKKLATKTITKDRYAYPIMIYDNFYALTESFNTGTIKFLQIEVNQSQNNQISVDYKILDKMPSEGDDTLTSEQTPIDNGPYSTLIFEPAGDCWELVSQIDHIER